MGSMDVLRSFWALFVSLCLFLACPRSVIGPGVGLVVTMPPQTIPGLESFSKRARNSFGCLGATQRSGWVGGAWNVGAGGPKRRGVGADGATRTLGAGRFLSEFSMLIWQQHTVFIGA